MLGDRQPYCDMRINMADPLAMAEMRFETALVFGDGTEPLNYPALKPFHLWPLCYKRAEISSLLKPFELGVRLRHPEPCSSTEHLPPS